MVARVRRSRRMLVLEQLELRQVFSGIVSANVYYKDSLFAANGTNVSAAIDTSKSVIKADGIPHTLSYSNITNYSRGINGMVFDIADLPSTNLSSADFGFSVSPQGSFAESTNPPSSWTAAPNPTLISVTPGNGAQPSRVRIEWANNAIQNRWLQMRVLANANTGLAATETYYIGNVIGEINGDLPGGTYFVTNKDLSDALPVGGIANVTSNRDIDKNGFVLNSDFVVIRSGVTGGTTLRNITIPPAVVKANQWVGYAGGAQHQAISTVASQPLETIRWQAPVDLAPQYSGNDLLIHYGTPLITTANTVIVPVKTGATSGFRIDARSGTNGSLLWTATTDYILPAHNWTPSYAPTLAGGRIYYPGAGGTVYWRDNVDSASATSSGQLAFYGIANYNANPSAFNSTVQICTPLTSDAAGNIYFGYRVSGTNPLGLADGFARIAPDGFATYVSASSLTSGTWSHTVTNAAPAISVDGEHVYVVASTGQGFGTGALLELSSSKLQFQASVALKDVKSGSNALLPDDGTASPMVGPDGDVYFGVLENPFPSNHDRGWMLHFNSNLSQSKIAGAFGWDDTASVVPASMVPSYHGTSTYLIMTKYNNYGSVGGDGVNKIAILDPNASMVDPITNGTVMKEVLTIAGVTPDPTLPAVREWCINTAVVDPATNSILANSEDGKLYRWDLTTNSFTQVVTLTPGIGEAYTPTMIGADGAVYAINNATLYSVGKAASGRAAPLPKESNVTAQTMMLAAPNVDEFFSELDRQAKRTKR